MSLAELVRDVGPFVLGVLGGALGAELVRRLTPRGRPPPDGDRLR